MDLKRYNDSPVQTSISFHVLIGRLKKAATGTGFSSERALQLLKHIEPYHELCEVTTDPDCLVKYTDIITELLADLFPAMLSGNEIKGITVPFQNILLNPTNRLQRILQEAGPEFNLEIRGFNHHQFYVNTCCLILNSRYGTNFNFTRALFYDIPNAQGIMKHYRVLYNTDFMELSPTDRAVEITPRDIELLRDNFDNLELWKKYFPDGSWLFKGFAIVNLFDATLENAVSALKGTLLGAGYGNDLNSRMLEVFRSVYKIPDLKIGFTSFDKAENKFSLATFSPGFKSYLLKDEKEEECIVLLKLVQQQRYFAISNIERLLQDEPDNVMARRLADQGIQSIILSPVVKNGHQLGIIELVSSKIGELNSINANQLEMMMPYITDAIERQYNFMQSQVQALIQNEYTTIHPSVCWKFRKEAQRALMARAVQKEYTLKSIIFKGVTPLYGQIDIKGSSNKRNSSVQLDLLAQLDAVIKLLQNLPVDAIEHCALKIKSLQEMAAEVQRALKADTEQAVQNYLETQIHPLLAIIAEDNTLYGAAINIYFLQAEKTGDYHLNRRKYDDTLTLINQKMAALLDLAQVDAQAAYHQMSIRFRLDEKRFDVDGSYNARFEVIKKRIDKACIKNSAERLTAVGKITIVYTNQEEEAEYLRYVSFLQAHKLFEDGVELLEIEELQGVSGLKAIRVKVNYITELPAVKFYSYNDLVCQEHAIVV